MTEIIRKITVDFARKGSTRLIFATQNDKNSRKIVIRLTDGGVPYPVSKTTVATVNFARPDGENGAFEATVEEDGSVSIVLSMWPLLVVGEVACSVSLFDGDEKKLTSTAFYLDVAESLFFGEEITSDENYSLLTDLISEVAGLKEVEVVLNETIERANTVAELIEEKLASGELNGEDGYTPVKGVDYFTDEEKAEMLEHVINSILDGDKEEY